jgi:hypothetical protein
MLDLGIFTGETSEEDLKKAKKEIVVVEEKPATTSKKEEKENEEEVIYNQETAVATIPVGSKTRSYYDSFKSLFEGKWVKGVGTLKELVQKDKFACHFEPMAVIDSRTKNLETGREVYKLYLYLKEHGYTAMLQKRVLRLGNSSKVYMFQDTVLKKFSQYNAFSSETNANVKAIAFIGVGYYKRTPMLCVSTSGDHGYFHNFFMLEDQFKDLRKVDEWGHEIDPKEKKTPKKITKEKVVAIAALDGFDRVDVIASALKNLKRGQKVVLNRPNEWIERFVKGQGGLVVPKKNNTPGYFLAFWDGNQNEISKAINKAKEMGLKVRVVEYGDKPTPPTKPLVEKENKKNNNKEAIKKRNKLIEEAKYELEWKKSVKLAHAIARTLDGNYRACYKMAWEYIRIARSSKKNAIKTLIKQPGEVVEVIKETVVETVIVNDNNSVDSDAVDSVVGSDVTDGVVVSNDEKQGSETVIVDGGEHADANAGDDGGINDVVDDGEAKEPTFEELINSFDPEILALDIGDGGDEDYDF